MLQQGRIDRRLGLHARTFAQGVRDEAERLVGRAERQPLLAADDGELRRDHLHPRGTGQTGHMKDLPVAFAQQGERRAFLAFDQRPAPHILRQGLRRGGLVSGRGRPFAPGQHQGRGEGEDEDAAGDAQAHDRTITRQV